MDYLKRLTSFLAGLLWPVRCAACGHGDVHACRACLVSLKPACPQHCPACRRPSAKGIPCAGCRTRTQLDRLICATPLNPTVESFVYALKYRGVRALAIPLADRLCSLLCLRSDAAQLFGANPLIVPVPLHATRLRERGYNQAELLAHRIASDTAMPMETESLIRVRATNQQAKAGGRMKRKENMSGAFNVIESGAIADRDIILIDDICTTGATLEDCARALRESGARSVSAITLARG